MAQIEPADMDEVSAFAKGLLPLVRGDQLSDVTRLCHTDSCGSHACIAAHASAAGQLHLRLKQSIFRAQHAVESMAKSARPMNERITLHPERPLALNALTRCRRHLPMARQLTVLSRLGRRDRRETSP